MGTVGLAVLSEANLRPYFTTTASHPQMECAYNTNWTGRLEHRHETELQLKCLLNSACFVRAVVH